tara:strand:- start:2802 stop:3359 length:558 start_codon:yes stop_codon:yes gene_type:complete
MSPIDFEDHAVTKVKQEDLKSISSLLQEQLKLEELIYSLEETLKMQKENLRTLSGETLPTAMAELGLTATEMYDGSKVKVVEDIYVSIPKDPEKSKECYGWLEANGLGDIIKNNVGISFGKGEGNKAKHLEETIKEMGLVPEVKISVHPSTLKATIKKWHEEGKSIPDNKFNLFIGQKTKITRKT